MEDDLKALRETLKLEAWQMIPTKEVLGTALAGVAMSVGAVATHGAIPLHDMIGYAGGTALIGGLLASRSKYVTARRKVLKEHPVAYLYEAGGGLRF